MMAWVAFDRAIKSVEQFHFDGPVEHWKKLRTRIHADVCRKGYDAEQRSFVRSYGSTELDASLLLLPTVGFLQPDDPRIKGTIEAIERRLMVDGEGVFLACSFWMVDAYVMLGRLDDAHALFKRLVGLCNDVGLLSEEYDPASGQLLGNFPQAFSHVALLNSAFNLTRAEKPAEQRAEQPAEQHADHSAAAT